ncbi:uncharacterized protein LOC126837984 isoform X2 [Adelges cooleyi]|uniref:uncharacterized protein LOC126837984 isoform X2 n=1 Tax=Adelges cooleyi TaxID=133065 RepID=UPI002180121B|nr:uncharacterized protein LOC126837984 isoform X2 [Adelges cooleyi]
MVIRTRYFVRSMQFSKHTMSKRPRTEPPNDDFWGDDFTCDEVNTIDNIETLVSQSHYPAHLNETNTYNNCGFKVESQTKEGEVKNLKMKIKQLEVQLSKTKQENDDKYKHLRIQMESKDTELKFQKQEITALQNKIKEVTINVSKVVPQKNVSFSCMKTGSNSKLLHDASEHFKKTTSTQTYQVKENYHDSSIDSIVEEINRHKNYEKLKKHLYPDLYGCPNINNNVKNNGSIQECHIILTKIIILEDFNGVQTYSLIKKLFQNCTDVIELTINTLKMSLGNADFVKREKELIYSYLKGNQHKSKTSLFDLQFSYLLDSISVLTTVTDLVSKVVFHDTNDTFKTIISFLQMIGSQSLTYEFILTIKMIVKFLTNVCNNHKDVSEQKQLEIFSIVKEIVFCRPPVEIIQELINLFCQTTIYPVFTKNLCQLPSQKTFILSESISTFTTGTCVLRVFCLQLEILKYNYYIISDFLSYVYVLLNSKHVPKWMNKHPKKKCECTSSFIELIIHFLYIIFNDYEKERDLFTHDVLKLVEEIIGNSYCILYRLGKLDDDFRSHIGKCKGRYDAIVGKIQKLKICSSNKFLVRELKRIEFKSLPSSQCSSNLKYEAFPIDIPKFTQKSQCQFEEPNKQNNDKIFQ